MLSVLFLVGDCRSTIVNHLQHCIGSQSFKAEAAVGSWYGTPLLPDIKIPTSTINNKMSRSTGKGPASEFERQH